MVAVDNARAGMAGSYILENAVTTKNVGNLESYRAKRKADRTPEPFGATSAGGQRFVVQQHAARRTHYDFRLEFDGVLKSWAVPKGPSPNPADKRLAVHVEDHPVDYVNFEGVIPPDNYGAGAVIVWDRGQWIALNDIAAGFDKGKLLFELRGHKLRGKWTLVKTKRGKNEWLLIKERDGYATMKGTEDYAHDSVLSGRTVEQVAGDDPRGAAVAAKLRKLGAARRELQARELRPMLATPGKPFSNPKWVFELKYDGYRLLAEKRAGEVKLYSRAGHDFTPTFPEIAEIVAALPFAQFIIDAEVVVLDDRGLPSFSLLQKRGRLTRRADVARAALELPASIYAFDLLAFEGFDLRALPLIERKATLRSLLPVSGALRYSEHFEEQGEALFDEAERLGLEGIIGKRAASPYVSKRSADWIKINAAKSDDFVVVGYLPPKQGGQGIRRAAARAIPRRRVDVRRPSRQRFRRARLCRPRAAARAKAGRGAAIGCRARARRRVARGWPRGAGQVQATHPRRHIAAARLPAFARRQESCGLRLANGCRGSRSG